MTAITEAQKTRIQETHAEASRQIHDILMCIDAGLQHVGYAERIDPGLDGINVVTVWNKAKQQAIARMEALQAFLGGVDDLPRP